MSADPGAVPDEGPPQGVLAGPGTITVIAGLTFAVSDELGDVNAGPLGLIVDDTRHLSRFEVMVDGQPLRQLGSGLMSPSVARFRSYATLRDRRPDAPVECDRKREVSAGGMAESITLRCWTLDPVRLRLSVRMGADFADIFQVRRLAGDPSAPATGDVVRRSAAHLCFQADGTPRTTTVLLDPAPDELAGGEAEWDVVLHRDRPWALRIEMQARRSEDSEDSEDRATSASPARAAILQDPLVRSRPEHLARGCRRSLVDLDALGIPDELDGSRRLLAAGIPWFVALFGRDALISSYQARAFRPELMLDAVSALAARQGNVEDPGNEEQPGKILHEVRFGDRPWLGEGTAGGARPYFGSVDSTPLFLIVLGQAMQWGAPPEALEPLLPAARAALGWLRGPGDPDGDGFVEYRPSGLRSLVNQGWKDSENGVQFADGSLPQPPIALLEVQGYAYRARCELATVLAHFGHAAEADELRVEAEQLRELIRARFWRPGSGGAPGS
ncbi:amylo-alpha-1,6-glucosidase, partial [Pseudonocardia sp. TRM90224]|uniref:amylo-alpha-1,6-glucosidase n=1 Tax=Pseudonocardia sp. TRM90224 TaxID=2812678 RepID=UPI001E521E8B